MFLAAMTMLMISICHHDVTLKMLLKYYNKLMITGNKARIFAILKLIMYY